MTLTLYHLVTPFTKAHTRLPILQSRDLIQLLWWYTIFMTVAHIIHFMVMTLTLYHLVTPFTKAHTRLPILHFRDLIQLLWWYTILITQAHIRFPNGPNLKRITHFRDLTVTHLHLVSHFLNLRAHDHTSGQMVGTRNEGQRESQGQ